MRADDSWASARVKDLVASRDAGGLIRYGRTLRGWRQSDLAVKLSCSVSTVSRLETGKAPRDLRQLQAAGEVLGIPGPVMAATVGLVTHRTATVTEDHRFAPAVEDPMHRRSLLNAAVGLAGTGSLATVAAALSQIPAPVSPQGASVDLRLADARELFDTGRHQQLLAAVPGLLAHAHQGARSHRELDQARLSAAYAITTGVLNKVGRYDLARTAGDRAMVYADVSGSEIAAAAAARELSIVLRHQDQEADARRVSDLALEQLADSGLQTDALRSAYAQMLCTTAYVYASAQDRSQALTLITEARKAAAGLPDRSPRGRVFAVTTATVQLYQVGIHWALGDAGLAIEAGRNLHEGQFPTAERRARLHTDLARAWHQMGKPTQTAEELLAALRASPAEVRDRSSIRTIVKELAERHPLASGVATLRAAV